jgi:hypothetical protein
VNISKNTPPPPQGISADIIWGKIWGVGEKRKCVKEKGGEIICKPGEVNIVQGILQTDGKL